MIFKVPGERVYRLSSVKSTRGARDHWLLATITPRKPVTSTAMAHAASKERTGVARIMSLGPAQIEQHGAHGQPEDDACDEINHVADIQNAARDGLEVLQKTQVGYGRYQPVRQG